MAMIEAPSTWWCWKENEWRCYSVCLSDCDDLFCSCGLSAISPPHLLFHEAVPFLTVIRYGHLFLFLCPPCKGPVLRVFKLYCFVLLTYSWLHPIFWSFLPSTLLSSWKAVESQSFSLYTKTYYHSSSIMHRLKKNTQVPGTNSYLLMNINFPGFWHRLLSEDWLQEEVEHSFHQFSGLKGSDGLVNGKQAETMTIPRAVRKDKSRSESELPGKMVPTSGASQRPEETEVMTKPAPASGCTTGTRWLTPKLGEVEKAPGRLLGSEMGLLPKKYSISSWLCRTLLPPQFGGNSCSLLLILFICLLSLYVHQRLEF